MEREWDTKFSGVVFLLPHSVAEKHHRYARADGNTVRINVDKGRNLCDYRGTRCVEVCLGRKVHLRRPHPKEKNPLIQCSQPYGP